MTVDRIIMEYLFLGSLEILLSLVLLGSLITPLV